MPSDVNFISLRFEPDRRTRLRLSINDVEEQITVRMRRWLRRVREATPVRTGRMKANWYWRRRGNSIVVGNRMPYAGVVIRGRRGNEFGEGGFPGNKQLQAALRTSP